MRRNFYRAFRVSEQALPEIGIGNRLVGKHDPHPKLHPLSYRCLAESMQATTTGAGGDDQAGKVNLGDEVGIADETLTGDGKGIGEKLARGAERQRP